MQLSYTENKMLRKLALLNIKKETTLVEIARQLNVSRLHPTFNHVIKMLFEANIFKLQRTIGKTKILTIDNSELRELIEVQPDFDEFENYAVRWKVYAN